MMMQFLSLAAAAAGTNRGLDRRLLPKGTSRDTGPT